MVEGNNDEQNTVTTEDDATLAVSSSPMQDIEFFVTLRDLVRSQYLWEWDKESDESHRALRAIPKRVDEDRSFHLVGDVELVENVFEITLWLEGTSAFTMSDVDLMLLHALDVDFERSTVFAREMSITGLTYHILSFGDGRAWQLHVNVIGPRMQQIRDLGTLVVPAVQRFTA